MTTQQTEMSDRWERQLSLSPQVQCEHCGKYYTGSEFAALELTGHNITWNFDYRRYAECGREMAFMELYEYANIGAN